MPGPASPRPDRRHHRLFEVVLWTYPASFRREYGPLMRQLFGDQLREARTVGRFTAVLVLWRRALADVLVACPRQWGAVLRRLSAVRLLVGAAVAVLAALLGAGAAGAPVAVLRMLAVVLVALPVAAVGVGVRGWRRGVTAGDRPGAGAGRRLVFYAAIVVLALLASTSMTFTPAPAAPTPTIGHRTP